MPIENDKHPDTPVGWTSLEQSICLVTCGLDPKSADMHYEAQFDEFGYPLYEWRLVAEKSRGIEENLFSWRQKYEEPCWSLGKLISIISSCNKKFENLHFFKETDIKNVTLFFGEADEFSGATELEACVNAIVWLLENRYI
jgi:hypothetical protein